MQFDGLFVSEIESNKKPNFGNAPIENQSCYQTSQVGFDRIVHQNNDAVKIINDGDINIQIVKITDRATGISLTVEQALDILVEHTRMEQSFKQRRISPFDRNNITIPRTKTTRQKDNDTAVSLMRELQASGRKAAAVGLTYCYILLNKQYLSLKI